jgi:hypothetical protein
VSTDVISSRINEMSDKIYQYENPYSPTLSSDEHDDHFSNSFRTEKTVSDELRDLWFELKSKRKARVDMRMKMAAKRRDLRELRRQKDAADNAFMHLLRPVLLKARTGTAIEDLLPKRMTEMQSIRNEYLLKEAEYEGMEMMIDEDEEDLTELETRFFSTLAAGPAPRATPPAIPKWRRFDFDQEEIMLEAPIPLLGISLNGPVEDAHPVFQQLMEAVGDLQNTREELDDLHTLREQAEYDLESGRLEPEMLEEAQRTVAEFPADRESLEAKIRALQNEVDQLKAECVDRQAMKKRLSPQEARSLGIKMESVDDIDLEDQSMEWRSDYALLLSRPEHLLQKGLPVTAKRALLTAVKLPADSPAKQKQLDLAKKEYSINHLVGEADWSNNHDFISRWLLQQLRICSLNILQLQNMFVWVTGLTICHEIQWQYDVLKYWYNEPDFEPQDETYSDYWLRGSRQVDIGSSVSISSFAIERAQTPIQTEIEPTKL